MQFIITRHPTYIIMTRFDAGVLTVSKLALDVGEWFSTVINYTGDTKH